jgi:glycosyltransferase, group 2 family
VELEHIIVDDGSHDDTPKIVRQYAAKYPHIKFIAFPQNRGTNAARNAAIKTASGDFCIILDSDDYFVDDALKKVDAIVSQNIFKHYCFVADDMIPYYQSCPLLQGKDRVIISYEDFLYEHIAGDFTHVIATKILLKYPFNEDLRIYEGVFFKRFYREVKRILYVNELVTIRERSRADSVIRTVFRDNKARLSKGMKSKMLLEEWFGDDLLKSDDGKRILTKTYKIILDCCLILSDYKKANEYMQKIKKLNISRIPIRLNLIYTFRLGELYFQAGRLYVFLRYRILKSKVQ